MPTKRPPLGRSRRGGECRNANPNISFSSPSSARPINARAESQSPRSGLLNIGSEALKGTSELRLAYQALLRLSLRPPLSLSVRRKYRRQSRIRRPCRRTRDRRIYGKCVFKNGGRHREPRPRSGQRKFAPRNHRPDAPSARRFANAICITPNIRAPCFAACAES